MGPDHHDIGHGLKLALVAVISAVMTAAVVICIGNAFMSAERASSQPRLIQVSDAG